MYPGNKGFPHANPEEKSPEVCVLFPYRVRLGPFHFPKDHERKVYCQYCVTKGFFGYFEVSVVMKVRPLHIQVQ